MVGYCGTANPRGGGGMPGNPGGGGGIKLEGGGGGTNPAGSGGGIGGIGKEGIEGGSDGRSGRMASADQPRDITRLERTHLALYREEDLLAWGYRRRYPLVPLQFQEGDPQAWQYRRNLGLN